MQPVMGTAVAALLVLTAFLAPLFLPVHLRMTVSERGITIEPRGLDALWTLRWRILIPADQITSIRVVHRDNLAQEQFGLPGVCLRGVIAAGSATCGGKRVLWDVRRGSELLVIYCRAESPYRAYVLEFPEPHAVLSRTQSALDK